MSGLREALQRFRPAGAPGAPTGGAVPADRQAEEAAELAPVFALLDAAQVRAREIRAEGDAMAAEIRSEAAQEARAIVRRAREQAPVVRDESRRKAAALAEAQAATMVARAQDRAAVIRRRAEQHVDGFAQRIVAEAVAELYDGDKSAGPLSADKALTGDRRSP